MTLSNLPPGVSGAEPQINPTDPPNALPELITPEQCYHLGDVVKDHGKGPYIITGMRLEVKRWDEEWLGDDDTGQRIGDRPGRVCRRLLLVGGIREVGAE